MIAEDLIKRADALAIERTAFEKVWREIAEAVMPNAPDFSSPTGSDLNQGMHQPRTADRPRKIYESTGVWAGDRLSAGLESLVTPQSEKWHGLALDDPLAPEASDEESEWFDRLRDYLFATRYDARAGFIESNQYALRNTVFLGTGLMFVDEGFGSTPIQYRPIPLNEAFLSVDHLGHLDTVYRTFMLPARVAVKRFEGKVSAKVKEDADDEKKKDRRHTFIHVVQPREERGSQTNQAKNSPHASFYIEKDEKLLISEGGFFDFPYIDYRWGAQPGIPYGEGPVMLALADIKTLNAMSKTALRAGQQAVDPPLAVADDGVINRPNLNARAVNYGAVDQNGRLKIQPIITAQRPDLAENIMGQRREAVRESLYINLFQALVQNPNMTATEAMIRNNEKGQLLGPAGATIQNGLSRLIDREIGILQRKGAFDSGSPLEPPESIRGREFGSRFTSPLDRLRRSNELVGVQQTLEIAAQIGQIDPGVFDNIDSDEAIRMASDINGAPQKLLRRVEERDELREQRQQVQQTQQAAQLAQEGAQAVSAVGEALPAAEALGELAQSQ